MIVALSLESLRHEVAETLAEFDAIPVNGKAALHVSLLTLYVGPILEKL
jgi:hypothetical protein